MKKLACLSLIATLLLLIASPALAGGNQTIWDLFDPNIGGGAILLDIGDDMYILISYTDFDDSQDYSAGDGIVRVQQLNKIPS